MYIAWVIDPSQSANNADGSIDLYSEMENMIRKYSQKFPRHQPSIERTTGDVILLTGSTGGLGSYILEALIRDSTVSRIYAFNRKSSRVSGSLQERQRASFEDRDIDVSLFESEKVVLLEGDTAAERLGLDQDVFDAVRTSVTCIIHNGM